MFRRGLADMGGLMRAVETYLQHVYQQLAKLPELGKIDVRPAFGAAAAAVPALDQLTAMYVICDAILGTRVTHASRPHATAAQTYEMLQITGSLSLEPVGESLNEFSVVLPFVTFFTLWHVLKGEPAYAAVLQPLDLTIDDKVVFWQSWEQFNVSFHALKYNCMMFKFGGTSRTLSELYSGAILGPDFDNEFVRCDRSRYSDVAEATMHFPASLHDKGFRVFCKGDYVHWNAGHTVRNADGAPSMDAWHVADHMHTIQTKLEHVKAGRVDLVRFHEEREKCQVHVDEIPLRVVFGFYTVAESDLQSQELPSLSLLVCRRNLRQFYTPVFADRATVFAFHGGTAAMYKLLLTVTVEQTVNANLAEPCHLEAVTGIGKAYANKIVERRPFSDVEDLKRRVPGLPRKSLALLST